MAKKKVTVKRKAVKKQPKAQLGKMPMPGMTMKKMMH